MDLRQKKGILFIVSAPSGAGKSTICAEVMRHEENLRFAISHTTRDPRSGEQDEVDYHFVSKNVFSRMKDAGEFVEWAEVYGNYYGTSREMLETLLAQGRDVIHDIDVQGAAQLRGVLQEAVFIFVLPPSIKTLAMRLRGRGTDADEVMAERLSNARGEIESYSLYDYVILNDALDHAVENFRTIVRAERLRASRVDPDGVLEEIFKEEEAKEDAQE